MRRDAGGGTENGEGNPALTGREYRAARTPLPRQEGREPGPADPRNMKKFPIPLQKILLIGTLGSGKTTLAKCLAWDYAIPYASIDECRGIHGNGTMAGEDTAWEHFLCQCRQPGPGVLEFSGMGPHAYDVRDYLLLSATQVTVIWSVLPVEVCIARARNRQKTIPFPYPLAPIEYAVPAIHAALEDTWDIVWKSEPRFHTIKLEFLESASVAEMYSAIKKTCFFS